MNRIIDRVISLFCVFMIILIASTPQTYASEDNKWSSAYAHTLNSAMLNCGVVSTPSVGGYVDISNGCPTGVIYADLVQFTNKSDPYLVLVYSDANTSQILTDIYKYNGDGKTAEIITTIRKSVNISSSRIAEISLAEGGDYRYIVYNEHENDAIVTEEYYTVINGDAFKRVSPPKDKTLFGVLSFTTNYICPSVDVSYYNHPLSVFFSTLKDSIAEGIKYDNILDDITSEEHKKISRVLSRTSGFTDEFDIGKYSSMSDYSLAVNRHDGEGQFNAITQIYDLGDEIYYIRYSTDLCFYNGTVVRRTDKVTDNYQILAVRNDFIPFSNAELKNLKDAYMKNRLVLEKSIGTMARKNEPLIKVNKLDIEKQLDVPQKISPTLRKPIALIGGGALLGLFILLWVLFSDDNK